MWLPLYNNFAYGANPGVNYSLSVANKPVFSDGDKTVTITLKHNYKWNDGKPVTAQDVLFDVALIKAAVAESAANWGSFTPGYFPQSLASISATGPYTVVMHLKRAFNPGFFLNSQLALNLTPLPSQDWNVASAGGPHLDFTVPANAKKIYDYLGKAGGQVGTFASNQLWKIADGPFVLSAFSPVTASWTLKANPTYGGTPKPSISSLQGVTYTGITPLLNAMRTNSLDVGSIDFSQLAAADSLKSPGLQRVRPAGLRLGRGDLELQEHGSPLRQDRLPALLPPGDGDAGQRAGDHRGDLPRRRRAGLRPDPVGTQDAYVPSNAVNPPYPYNPAKAVSILKAHGWHVVPNGQTTCANPGTGANQCGAGIPKGTPISFPWATETAAAGPYVPLTDEAIASEAKQAAGINIQLFQKTFNYIASNYNNADPSVAKYTNDWAVENFSGYTDNPYPTQSSIFNTGGSFNSGTYSDPTMDRLIKNSVYGSDPNAVTKEASYETEQLPALFQPNYDLIYGVAKRVGGPPQSYLSLTQYGLWPQFWWVNKK